ncbi:hypothetical protein ACKI2C_50150, partial [Streptomyces brasiliscabiei]
KTAADYVSHHLHHLSSHPHDTQFVTLDAWHFDTLFISTLLGLLFIIAFRSVARKATPGVPGKFQAFLEILIEFVDDAVKSSFEGSRK